MTKETMVDLNTLTLIGNTDKRGPAWHFRALLQGDEPNHYIGAVPRADVVRRLFSWEPVEVTPRFLGDYIDRDGFIRVIDVVDNTRKGIIRSDTGAVLGVFRDGYTVHGYEETLLAPLDSALEQGLEIGSAGLLKGGALAWVQLELPESVDTPEGVTFRPFVNSTTSLDGSLSSKKWAGVQVIVCDNTLGAALGETNGMLTVKHSRNSLPKVLDMWNAQDTIAKIAESFQAQVRALCEIDVSDRAWQAFVESHTQLDKRPEEGSGRTRALNTVETLTGLWNADERVSPWKGTAFGVVQAVNTHAHHFATAKHGHVEARNMLRVVSGGIDDLDSATLATLNKVLQSA